MLNATRETGVTLIEVLVASTLLTIGLLAAARVVAASSTTNRGARTVTQATVLAVDKMEQLRAASIDDPALALSPPDALAMDIDGYRDRPAPPFVRRWSVEPLPSYPDNGVVVRVVAIRAGVPGRTLLEAIKVRKPVSGEHP